MEWGVTRAHEEQVWDRGVLCVYPGKKRNRKMGYFKGFFYTTLLSSCEKKWGMKNRQGDIQISITQDKPVLPVAVLQQRKNCTVLYCTVLQFALLEFLTQHLP